MSAGARYVRRADALWRRSGTTVLALSSESGDIVSITGIGPALWELLAEARTAEDTVGLLSDTYGVSTAQVSAAVVPVLEELDRRGLVVVESD